MQLIVNILKQELIGVINLSLPIIIVYQLYPVLFLSLGGKLLYSCLIGFIVYYLNYKATKNQANNLTFMPSGICKDEFDKTIKECAIDPEAVRVRYGYSNEMIGITMFNTISLDPLLWHQSDSDPEMEKAKHVIDVYISPQLSYEQKTKIEKIKAVLSPHAQRFIFKHELGHVVDNYSNKKLIIAGIIGAIAAFIGISAAFYVNLYLISVVVGIMVGGILDLLLSYASNIIFKSKEEIKADMFAAKYSSKEDIVAAADFFEQHQKIHDAHKQSMGILANLPPILLSGHADGKQRADYLRKIAAVHCDYKKS